MNKENLNGKELLSNPFDQFPENLKRYAVSLKERGKKISFKPFEYQQALSLLPDLEKCANAYKHNLEKFVSFIPNLKKKSSDDFFHREIRDFLTHEMGCLITNPDALDENQKNIINTGKDRIGAAFQKNSDGWNAIYSFFFNCLHDFYPQNEIFKIKPDPFATLLNFAERGVIIRMDQTIQTDQGEKPEIFIDIPIISKADLFVASQKENQRVFYGCWAPFKENSLLKGHLEGRQDCSCRKPLDNGQLIVNNEDYVRPNIRPAGWG
jgi:hypothetical protein